jgi:SAM-dependent methyltransferase
MSAVDPNMPDPRWGQYGREKKADAILSTLQAHLGRTPGGTWLDIGCGSGGIAAALAAKVDRVVGVDPEPWERWNAFQEQHANLQFLVGNHGDVRALLGAAGVDVVICNQVYEHVDDPLGLIRSIHEVLGPGGVCYFAGPNLLWPIEPHVFWPFVHWLPRRFARDCMRVLGSKHSAELDAWSWSYWRLMRAFKSVGFDVSNVLSHRVRVEAAASRQPILRLAARVPRALYAGLTPFAPAFAFVLTRSSPAAVRQ